MYIIEPWPLTTFIDKNLKLPRFQRKATWKDSQNFELAISVFQEYPVGVVIINQEDNNSKNNWLLDGRQRRTALQAMRSNPIDLYLWAKSYLGFNKTADVKDVIDNYWSKVDKYLENETSDSKANKQEDNEEDINEYGGEETEVETSFDIERQRKGLTTLLNMILMVHQITPKGSKWEKLFDFTPYFYKITYQDNNSVSHINPVKLREFILRMNIDFHRTNDDDITEEFFLNYFYENMIIKEEPQCKEKFEKTVSQNWEEIKQSVKTIDQFEKVLNDARIGVIRLTQASPLDAQNIFSRINKGGTQLKAEELLSAKPFWNIEVNTRDKKLIDNVNVLYKRLGVSQPNGVVRWDLAATLLERIKDYELFFKNPSAKNEKDVDMDQITLGFKLLSSYFENGMSAKSVTALEKNKKIDWDNDIDTFVEDINKVIEILYTDNFFKMLSTWNNPMTAYLGNAIVLEFLTIILIDWKSKGKPTVQGAEFKSLIRDAKILFDRVVYEYCTKTWRGSGDSRMATDIKNWKSRIKAVPESDWKQLIEESCSGTLNGQYTTVKQLKPILYLSNLYNDMSTMFDSDSTFDVDHIIPQEKFKGNSMVNEQYKDCLSNLALLPKKDNISKKSKALNEITDTWLKDSIVKYSNVRKDDFDKYSDISNIEDLIEFRREIFMLSFTSKRSNKLSN